MRFIRRRFESKLIITYVLLVSIVTISGGVYTYHTIKRKSIERLESNLISMANLVSFIVSDGLRKNLHSDEIQNLIEALKKPDTPRITLIDINGTVIAESGVLAKDIASMENHRGRPEFQKALSGEIGKSTRYSETLKTDMLYVAIPVYVNKNLHGALRLAMSLGDVDKILSSFQWAIIYGAILVISMAAVLSFIIARKMSSPINEMISIADRFGAGDFSRKISVYSQDELGKLAKTLNYMADKLNERMRELIEERLKMSAILNSMMEGVIAFDRDGRIIMANPGAARAFGKSDEDLTGKKLIEVIRNKEFSDMFYEVLESKSSCQREVSLLYPKNQILRINCVPLEGDSVVSGVLFVLHDITEIKRLESIRTEFVANVSHELKTPLTLIKGYLETLLDDRKDLREDSLAFLEIAFKNTKRLSRLIDDLLDLSNIELGRIKINKKSISVSEAVENTLTFFSEVITKKELVIQREIPEDLPQAYFDRDRFIQILTNLIDNSIKFTPSSGIIYISAKSVHQTYQKQDSKLEKKDAEIESFIEISVKDTGCGIPSDDLHHISERFYVVDKARSREMGGTGLGLAIVKHLILAHGGTFKIESELGKGTTVIFTIPSKG